MSEGGGRDPSHRPPGRREAPATPLMTGTLAPATTGHW
jgi:hypothetical protein